MLRLFMQRMGRLGYYLIFAARFLYGKVPPVVAGISITDACNLDCAHCWRKNQGRGHVPYARIVSTLRRLWRMGARYLYIQGGEPFIWRDDGRSLADIVATARAIGFFHTTVCTNGTFPLDIQPHSFSVSLDGLAPSHNRIRNATYAQVLANITTSRHPNIFINLTLNRINQGDLTGLVRLAARTPQIRGLIVNFHIPYPGVEHLRLQPGERVRLAEEALALKKRGYPVFNSVGGLRALARNDWKRPLDCSVVTDCYDCFSCCRARGDAAICRECGYGPWAEASRLFAFDLRSVYEVLRRIGGSSMFKR